jgi:hypothetical protein
MPLADNAFLGTEDGDVTNGNNWSLGHAPDNTERADLTAQNWSGGTAPTGTPSARTWGGLKLGGDWDLSLSGLDLSNVTLLADTPADTDLTIMNQPFGLNAPGVVAPAAAVTILSGGGQAVTIPGLHTGPIAVDGWPGGSSLTATTSGTVSISDSMGGAGLSFFTLNGTYSGAVTITQTGVPATQINVYAALTGTLTINLNADSYIYTNGADNSACPVNQVSGGLGDGKWGTIDCYDAAGTVQTWGAYGNVQTALLNLHDTVDSIDLSVGSGLTATVLHDFGTGERVWNATGGPLAVAHYYIHDKGCKPKFNMTTASSVEIDASLLPAGGGGGGVTIV